MNCNTRNRSNDTTESQKKNPHLMLLFSTVSQISRDLNNIYLNTVV